MDLKIWDPKTTIKAQLREWKHFTMLISAMTKAGKSYLLKDILKKIKGEFDFIVVFSKTLEAGGYDYLDTKIKFDYFNDEVVRDLKNAYYKKVEESDGKIKFKTLIIIDDCITNNFKYNETISELFMSGRHWQCSVVILGQKCSLLSTIWMANTTIFVSMFCGSKREKLYIAENILSNVINEESREINFAADDRASYNLQTDICKDFWALIVLPMEKKNKLYKYKAR
jgi:hypothetical protein